MPIRSGWLLLSLLLSLPALAQSSSSNIDRQPPAPELNPFLEGKVVGGEHIRLDTPAGTVHLWWPNGYHRPTAGTVIYVHGYFTSVDQAWVDHRLPEQFAASRRNALFIVPEAPSRFPEPVAWPELEPLLRRVRVALHGPLPPGPLVLAGHSGAFRTMLGWLDHPLPRSLVLLDGLYRNEKDFGRWVLKGPSKAPRQLLMVALETIDRAERFALQFRGSKVVLDQIPGHLDGFGPNGKSSRLVYARSQFEHMELIEGGRILPLFLQLTPLRELLPTTALDSPPHAP